MDPQYTAGKLMCSESVSRNYSIYVPILLPVLFSPENELRFSNRLRICQHNLLEITSK